MRGRLALVKRAYERHIRLSCQSASQRRPSGVNRARLSVTTLHRRLGYPSFSHQYPGSLLLTPLTKTELVREEARIIPPQTLASLIKIQVFFRLRNHGRVPQFESVAWQFLPISNPRGPGAKIDPHSGAFWGQLCLLAGLRIMRQ